MQPHRSTRRMPDSTSVASSTLSPQYSPTAPPYAIQSISLHNRSVPIHRHLYRFKEELGKGDFGAVHAAVRLSDNKQVAIRVMSLATMHSADAAAFENVMFNEMRAAKSLRKSSSHVIDVYDFDVHSQTRLAFLVMERGQQNLETALQLHGKLLPKDRKELWRQLLDIAVALHNRNITHLNIRPNTLFMFPQNQVKLADMGFIRKALTRSASLVAPMWYSAPEIAYAPSSSVSVFTPKADIWSWGAILYRVAYSVPPEYKEPCYQPPPATDPSRDPHLIDVLKHTLVRNPAQRADAKWLAAHPFSTAKAPS